MKGKAIFWGLILMAILLFMVYHSQARMGPPYYADPLGYPSEHPWQHNDSQEPNDTLGCWTTHIVILPISPSMKGILWIQNTSEIKGSSDASGGPKNNHIQILPLRKSR
jgi:hypothetical protein